MRQKYMISLEGNKNQFKIKEYAIINHIPKNALTMMMQKENYSLVGEESYDHAEVVDSIAKGRRALISVLRTKNIYPIEPYAREIAESVMSLCESPNEDPVELFFDDAELLPKIE